MIRIFTAFLLAALLSGCTVYQSIGVSAGTYLSEPDGQEFRPVKHRWDFEHTALLYVYRPASQWADDELESPSFYVNDEHKFNLKGRGYTWYELEPGIHHIVMRRPLMGLEGVKMGDFLDFTLKQIAQFDLSVNAGQVYYLRYSEVEPIEPGPSEDLVVLSDGPLQLVPASVALAEIGENRMLDYGRELIAAAPVPAPEEVSAEAQIEAEENTEGGPKAKPKTKEEEWWPF